MNNISHKYKNRIEIEIVYFFLIKKNITSDNRAHAKAI